MFWLLLIIIIDAPEDSVRDGLQLPLSPQAQGNHEDEHDREGDIAISYTGLRPGEKLFEELLIGDNVAPTEHSRIFRAMEQFISWQEMEVFLGRLTIACESNDRDLVKSLLFEVPTGYLMDSPGLPEENKALLVG